MNWSPPPPLIIILALPLAGGASDGEGEVGSNEVTKGGGGGMIQIILSIGFGE
jgi:hypothetical protein